MYPVDVLNVSFHSGSVKHIGNTNGISVKKVRVSFVTVWKLGLLYQTLIVEVVVLHQIQAR